VVSASARHRVHPTAVVDPRAELAEDVEVGPFAVVGAGVRIGAGCRIHAHAVVYGPLAMGERNTVHAFAVLGGEPQHKKPGGVTRVDIGDDNTFREHVTVHRGTLEPTRIGSKNLFMAQAHVAHDVQIGSSCTIANAVQLAGHVVVGDHATFGGLAGVAQFVRVGVGAFVAAGAMVERDVPPFCIVQGDRARVRAVNRVGLERQGVPAASIAEIERIFRAVFAPARARRPRAEILAELSTTDTFAAQLLAALRRPA
jgi:UDP-N-acetylglucosamine acyltransferase